MKKELTDEEIDVILLLAENDMNVTKTARMLFKSRTAMVWRLKVIKKKTNFDPMRFYGLVELVKIAKERKWENNG